MTKKKHKKAKHTTGVRSGDAVRAKFRAREEAILKALEAEWVADGGLSKDERSAKGRREGRIVENPDGTETIQMTPAFRDLLVLRGEMFAFKFGRPMGPTDLLFFDEDANVPNVPWDLDAVRAECRAAATRLRVDPDDAHRTILGSDDLDDYDRSTH
jgi:hypothetical protein